MNGPVASNSLLLNCGGLKSGSYLAMYFIVTLLHDIAGQCDGAAFDCCLL